MPTNADVRVFVSSTRKDLLAKHELLRDCRQSAIEAVVYGGGVPIDMGTWVAAYDPPIELCKKKLLGSSHYLGIFAFRRGFEPPKLKGKSLTEAEFDWAFEHKKPIAILIPEPLSVIGLMLQELAKDETEAQRLAQQAFLERVHTLGAYMPFETPSELSSKVTRLVLEWKYGDLESLAAALEEYRSGSTLITDVGRRVQINQFLLALTGFEGVNPPKVAAFLIHGADGMGHEEMAFQIRKTLKLSGGGQECEHIVVNCQPTWREASLRRLFEVLDMGQTPQAVALQLEAKLSRNDVILEIGDLHRFDGSLSAFIENFWRAVVSSMTKSFPFRLIAILRFGKPAPAEFDALLQTVPLGGAFDELRPVKLPRLEAFTEEELEAWLTNKLSAAEAKEWAKALIDDSGGQPQSIYHKLRIHFG